MEAVSQYIASNQLLALAIILGVMVFGEFVSRITKGIIPSGIVAMFTLIFGFWTFLPKTLASDAHIAPLFTISVMFLIVHLGSLIDRKQMVAQWRTIVTCLIGIVFICLFTVAIGAPIFGWANAVVAAPVLTGGTVAATIMQEAAKAVNNNEAVLVALVVLTIQNKIGLPIIAVCLRRETKVLRQQYQGGLLETAKEVEAQEAADAKRPAGRKMSTIQLLFRVGVLAYLATLLDKVTGGHISMYVWALVLGFIGNEVHFLPGEVLSKARSDGFLLMVMMGVLYCGSSIATPSVLLAAIGASLGLCVISTVGLFIAGLVSWRIFRKHESFWMCFAMVLNAYIGFPLNVVAVNEALMGIDDAKEKEAISRVLMPKMLISGFTCVTIVSVFVAGVMKNYL